MVSKAARQGHKQSTSKDLTRAEKWSLVRGTNLKPEDRHCLLILFFFQGDGEVAYCKQETMAEEMGICSRAIRKRLQRLNDVGAIRSLWMPVNGTPMRTYGIQFDALKRMQRSNSAESTSMLTLQPGRNHSSDRESINGRNESSGWVGTTVPGHQEPQFLQEHPENIHRKSKHRNSSNSGERKASFNVAQVTEENPDLIQLCTRWNQWHDQGLVSRRIRNTSSPGVTIVQAWRRSLSDKEQRERLMDLESLRLAIEKSQEFLKGKAWFDAAALIGGKNTNNRWYCEMLVDGQYAGNAQTQTTGDQHETAVASDVFSRVMSTVKRSWHPDLKDREAVRQAIKIRFPSGDAEAISSVVFEIGVSRIYHLSGGNEIAAVQREFLLKLDLARETKTQCC